MLPIILYVILRSREKRFARYGDHDIGSESLLIVSTILMPVTIKIASGTMNVKRNMQTL